MGSHSVKKKFTNFLLLSFGLIIFTTMVLVAALINRSSNEIENETISAEINLVSNSIDNKLTTIIGSLTDVSKKSVVLNPLMQYKKDSPALLDFLSTYTVMGDSGSLMLFTFDGEAFVGNLEYNKKTLVQVIDEKVEYAIEIHDVQNSLFNFYVPMIFNGSLEGVIVFQIMIDFDFFSSTLGDKFNLVVSDGIKTIEKGIVNDFSVYERSVILESGIEVKIQYDKFRTVKEKYKQIGFIYLILTLIMTPLGYFFYKRGENIFVNPHERLVATTKTLDEMNSLNQGILNSTDHMIIATDLEGVITVFNDGAEKNLGYLRSELVGKETPGIFHVGEEVVKRTEELNDEFSLNLAPGFTTFVYKAKHLGVPEDREWTYKRKDGSMFSVRLVVSAIKNLNQVVGYLGIAEDVTEIKKARETERKALAETEKLAKLKSEFLANMSHEIRTPMNGVIGMADLLLHSKLDNEQKEFVEIIKKSGDFLLSVINDILDFSKIESDKMIIENRSFDLAAAVGSVTSVLSSLAKEKEVDLIIDNSFDKLLYLGDEHRIQQILFNFASNAIKFTPQGGDVLIKVETEGDSLMVSVADTGIGISPEKQKTLFDAFTQADASTTRKYGGSGLGLAICKKLSEMMGAEIRVDSKEGFGSKFTLTLPFSEHYRTSEIEKSNLSDELSGKNIEKYKVLVVEDNKINQKVIRSMLSKMDQEVSIANDGVEALEVMEKEGFDIVFMDMQMPRMDGVECTKEIRKKYGDKHYVVALTANAFGSDRDLCLAAGMNDFLTKPIKKDLLKQSILKYQGLGESEKAS